jgi:hypothetical protein
MLFAVLSVATGQSLASTAFQCETVLVGSSQAVFGKLIRIVAETQQPHLA